jgi:hypothetical protein
MEPRQAKEHHGDTESTEEKELTAENGEDAEKKM